MSIDSFRDMEGREHIEQQQDARPVCGVRYGEGAGEDSDSIGT